MRPQALWGILFSTNKRRCIRTDLEENIRRQLDDDIRDRGYIQSNTELIIRHFQVFLETSDPSISKINAVLSTVSSGPGKINRSTYQKGQKVIHRHNGDDVDVHLPPDSRFKPLVLTLLTLVIRAVFVFQFVVHG